MLMKKFFVYKLMGSNMFINHALTGMNLSYRLLGVRFTNFMINSSVGSIFTSGDTVQTLRQDLSAIEKQNINGIANYSVEGLKEMDEEKVANFFKVMKESIVAMTEGRSEGHLAIKLTTLISMDILTRLSRAQQIFMNDILKYDKQDPIQICDVRNSLIERGITFTEEELQGLFDSLKFEHNKHEDKVTRLEIYANAHLYKLFESPVGNDFLKRIAIGCGVGVSEDDMEVLDTFKARIVEMTTLANERNCLLYVDAEQSYVQDAIVSWGQQLTHRFNRGDKCIIMNGYQCYLK
mmetsp:Transcript_28725/g.43386  ORF Transcript_28725/g.43386 Transcript_28725/m.43386 type:complete len:293 (+) Transcript_28725:238-1116(+)